MRSILRDVDLGLGTLAMYLARVSTLDRRVGGLRSCCCPSMGRTCLTVGHRQAQTAKYVVRNRTIGKPTLAGRALLKDLIFVSSGAILYGSLQIK